MDPNKLKYMYKKEVIDYALNLINGRRQRFFEFTKDEAESINSRATEIAVMAAEYGLGFAYSDDVAMLIEDHWLRIEERGDKALLFLMNIPPGKRHVLSVSRPTTADEMTAYVMDWLAVPGNTKKKLKKSASSTGSDFITATSHCWVETRHGASSLKILALPGIRVYVVDELGHNTIFGWNRNGTVYSIPSMAKPVIYDDMVIYKYI